MGLISKEDDETLKAIKMSVRTKSRDKMIEYFRIKAKTNESDPEAWFNYSLMNWEVMATTENYQERFIYSMEFYRSATNTLAINNEHWPMLYLQSSTFVLRDSKTVDSLTLNLINPGEDDEDAEKKKIQYMIDIQDRSEPQPYFFITYLLMACSYINKRDLGNAVKWIKSGLEKNQAGEVRYLAGFLSNPSIILSNKIKKIEKLSRLREELINRHNILFPLRKISV